MLEHHFGKNFRKWIPHQAVDGIYDVEKIGFEGEAGFVVLLCPDYPQKETKRDSALQLTWDRIISYTVTDESYRPELWISGKAPDQETWNFYISETSDYLTKFRQQNYLVPEKTYHFLICGYNLMVDILSEEHPSVTFLKWNPELQR